MAGTEDFEFETYPELDLHEQERLRVQAEAPDYPERIAYDPGHAGIYWKGAPEGTVGNHWAVEAEAVRRYNEQARLLVSERARVLALIDRELRQVRLADGQLGDVLRALRKDVEEGVEAPQVHPERPLVDQSTSMVTETRAAAEEA